MSARLIAVPSAKRSIRRNVGMQMNPTTKGERWFTAFSKLYVEPGIFRIRAASMEAAKKLASYIAGTDVKVEREVKKK